MDPENWIALASAAVSVAALVASTVQTVMSRRQSKTAVQAANSALESADAARRQATAAEQQRDYAVHQFATLRRQQDLAALARLQPAFREFLAAKRRLNSFAPGRAIELHRNIEKLLDETANAASIAASPDIADQIRELHQVLEQASVLPGIGPESRVRALPTEERIARQREERSNALSEITVHIDALNAWM